MSRMTSLRIWTNCAFRSSNGTVTMREEYHLAKQFNFCRILWNFITHATIELTHNARRNCRVSATKLRL